MFADGSRVIYVCLTVSCVVAWMTSLVTPPLRRDVSQWRRSGDLNDWRSGICTWHLCSLIESPVEKVSNPCSYLLGNQGTPGVAIVTQWLKMVNYIGSLGNWRVGLCGKSWLAAILVGNPSWVERSTATQIQLCAQFLYAASQQTHGQNWCS